MGKKLSDIWLFSDLDGTLVNREGVIPKRNREAIIRFVRQGGRFSVATGRALSMMEMSTEGLPINAPCIVSNGGEIYDFPDRELLFRILLPPNASQYVRRALSLLPGIGLIIIRDNTYYMPTESGSIEEHSTYFEGSKKSRFQPCRLQDLDGLEWQKALFAMEPSERVRVQALLEEEKFPGVRFVASDEAFIEMLPESCSKASAIQKLVDQGMMRWENVAAIGDYYNDFEMIQMAGIGATLQTAPADIREQAAVLTGPCGEGAVADLIEYLERTCTE